VRPVSEVAGVPVAVLMSVFARDEPELFERALVSIVRQDYGGGPVRLYLCVDGPVPHGIDAVLERHARSIHRILRNPENLGLARSLNRLLDALADEQFVFRMDSDDFSHAHRVSTQVEALRSLRDVDILGGAIREVGRDGRVLRIVRYPADRDQVRRFVARRSPVAHPTVCFRREAIGRFVHYPEVPVNQDWALWYECLALGLVISSLDDVLVDMTVSDDFFRRRGAGRALDEFWICCRGIRRLYGRSWRLAYPALRLAFRLLPQPVIRFAYRSWLR
jgi:glycosyltransferase involved in cell wall biosynthesis